MVNIIKYKLTVNDTEGNNLVAKSFDSGHELESAIYGVYWNYVVNSQEQTVEFKLIVSPTVEEILNDVPQYEEEVPEYAKEMPEELATDPDTVD